MAENTLGAESARVTDTTNKTDMHSAVQSLIKACGNPVFDTKYKWEVLQHHWDAAEILWRADHPDFAPDEMADVSADLAAALMETPAPHAAALRWKLDYVLAPSHGDTTECYTKDYVAQTVADYRRLLGDA